MLTLLLANGEILKISSAKKLIVILSMSPSNASYIGYHAVNVHRLLMHVGVWPQLWRQLEQQNKFPCRSQNHTLQRRQQVTPSVVAASVDTSANCTPLRIATPLQIVTRLLVHVSVWPRLWRHDEQQNKFPCQSLNHTLQRRQQVTPSSILALASFSLHSR